MTAAGRTAPRRGPRAVVPFEGRVDATATVPGSKSFTNRALVTAALAHGTSVLDGTLDSDDTEAMMGCLRAVGVGIEHDPASHRTVVVGVSGDPKPTTAVLDARASGTTGRFMLPLLALGEGDYALDGHAQLRARPMADAVGALRHLGVEVTSSAGDDRLPLKLRAHTITGGSVRIAGSASSQFLSGLLLSAPCFGGSITVEVDGDLISKPYVDMTIATMKAFGATMERHGYERFAIYPTGYMATNYRIEPDASAASYMFAAAAITGGRVRVDGLGVGALQGDVAFVDALARMGCAVTRTAEWTEVSGPAQLRGVDIDMSDCSDTAQTLAAVAVFADVPTSVRGIDFIRRKETDRIAAVVTELRRCGIDACEDADGFTIVPGLPAPTTVTTYDDHRMAMSFALLGLRAPGIVIDDPDCVAKTFPGYFDALESLRPGARIGAGT